MDLSKEQEGAPQEKVEYGNTPKDDLNYYTAIFDVLKEVGFNITYDEEGAEDRYGKPLPDHYRVFINAPDEPKLRKITDLLLPTPEGRLFNLAAIGDPRDLIDQFVDRKYIDVYDEASGEFRNKSIAPWVENNGRLIERALKLAYLRQANRFEENALPKERMRTVDTPAEWIDRAQRIRQHVDESLQEEPALDPEGMRIVIRHQVDQIIIQHPELKPVEHTTSPKD